MKTTLKADDTRTILSRLATANDAFSALFPGDPGDRQPVHTVYGGAHLFKAGTTGKLGSLALRSLQAFGPDAESFGAAVGVPVHLRERVYARVIEKLEREPVEDFRIDFEDGYGNRPDEHEDATAVQAAQQVAAGMREATLPPYIGIRIKPFSRELHARAVRTLDIFLTTLCGETGGALPDNFVVTLPKVTIAEQVAALVALFEQLEPKLGIAPGGLKLEIMIETTQSLFDSDGRLNLPHLVRAGAGRCVAAHFGTYDYTASCDVTAEHQGMTHPACDFARELMKVSYAQTGVWLSDGATNIMPVAPHRVAKDGRALTAEQERENLASVHGAWRLHFDQCMHSLYHAYYQGWDLHPAQLPTRYAAVYTFFLGALESGAERLENFISKAAQATLVGDVFDDAATGQGLLNFFLRGVNCGAITEEEALAIGITLEELRGKSFLTILENRKKV
jgi:citrate lyase beta subunit